MAELITREDTIKYLCKNMTWYDEDGSIADDDIKLNQITDLVYAIQGVEERKQGEWKKTLKNVMGEGYMWFCSNCGHEVYQDTSRPYPSEKFCPNCGADMRGSENG